MVMKLSGTLRSGRHLLGNLDTVSKKSYGKSVRGPKIWWKKTLKILMIIGGVAVVATAAALAYYKLAVAPPEVNTSLKGNDVRRTESTGYHNEPPINSVDIPPTGNEVSADDGIRDMNKFAFIMFCTDGSANTDVIMVATFDAANHTLNVVSIPRDTMANVSWSSKKVNAIRANRRIEFKGQDNAEDKAMQATIESFADILGFEVDFWFNVDMKAFVTLVNAVGGVDYYIPSNMEYHDNEQNLHISYRQGMKRGLTGQQALEILRFRRYASGDIARISNQQGFLKAAAEQILAKRNSINVIDLANIFINNVKTNLPLNNLVWLGKELLKMEAEDVNFMTLPGNYVDSVDGASYVTVYVEPWLEMVNEYLNPFRVEITDQDVSILTRGADRKLYVTDGNRLGNSSWGSSSRGASYDPNSSAGGSQSSSSPKSSSSSSSTSSQPAKPNNNTPSDSSNKTSQNPPGDVDEVPDTGSSENLDDFPDTDVVTTYPPSDEIPPLDEDPGQTQTDSPDNAAPQTDAPPEATTPPADASPISPDAPPVEAVE
ncbi:MAG: LCP family protein [Oscillospiraceae bacterium]|nr:LCP family protein [Oscillospiraceae bacterium]MCL2151562.1 LCP family protein [Oscillospiraceae bacterium]